MADRAASSWCTTALQPRPSHLWPQALTGASVCRRCLHRSDQQYASDILINNSGYIWQDTKLGMRSDLVCAYRSAGLRHSKTLQSVPTSSSACSAATRPWSRWWLQKSPHYA